MDDMMEVTREQWSWLQGSLWKHDLIIAELVRRLGGDVTVKVKDAMAETHLSVERLPDGALRLRWTDITQD